MRTVAVVFANLPIDLNTICMDAADPIISDFEAFFGFASLFSSSAFLTIAIASSKSKGFGIYSNAPPPYASIAACISVNAVIIITGNFS